MLQILTVSLKECKNFFLSKYHQAKSPHPYPLNILPRAEYLPGIDIDLLHSDIECAIIRRSNYANGGTFHTDSGVLREDAIADEAEEVLGLSLILLGGEFQIHHIVLPYLY